MVIEALLRQSPRRQRVTFAWQGWQLCVPSCWNPITLDGSFSSGQALLADLDEPRLGLRWEKLEAERVTQEFLEHVVRQQADGASAGRVRHLTAGDANDARSPAAVYLDPRLPGRDVYVTWASQSRRLIELVYHARERDDVLMSEIVPSLRETVSLPWQPWAVLDLCCAVPAGFALQSQDLRAGNLQLNWSGRHGFIAVRQLAPAELALKRTTLEHLVRDAQRHHDLQYKADATVLGVTLANDDGRELVGKAGHAVRRRRFFWRRGLPPQRVTLALHDRGRNRIVIVEADNHSLAREVALTVGGELH